MAYLREETVVDVVFYNGQVIDIRLPTFVELKVTDTPPGSRETPLRGGTKPATLETGVSIQVPLFISNGETVRVDTRSGEYIERA